MDADSEIVGQTGPYTVNYWEEQSVTVNFVENLQIGAMYRATVLFATVSGSDISKVEVGTTFRKCCIDRKWFW